MKTTFIVAITAMIVVSIIFFTRRTPSFPTTSLRDDVLNLFRQSARYAVAAEQDESEIIALMHANYAAGFLWSIKELVGSEEFKEITGTDFLEFQNKIQKVQDKATKNLVAICPVLVKNKDPLFVKAMYSSTGI